MSIKSVVDKCIKNNPGASKADRQKFASGAVDDQIRFEKYLKTIWSLNYPYRFFSNEEKPSVARANAFEVMKEQFARDVLGYLTDLYSEDNDVKSA